jgi:hypothetical protein
MQHQSPGEIYSSEWNMQGTDSILVQYDPFWGYQMRVQGSGPFFPGWTFVERQKFLLLTTSLTSIWRLICLSLAPVALRVHPLPRWEPDSQSRKIGLASDSISRFCLGSKWVAARKSVNDIIGGSYGRLVCRLRMLGGGDDSSILLGQRSRQWASASAQRHRVCRYKSAKANGCNASAYPRRFSRVRI